MECEAWDSRFRVTEPGLADANGNHRGHVADAVVALGINLVSILHGIMACLRLRQISGKTRNPVIQFLAFELAAKLNTGLVWAIWLMLGHAVGQARALSSRQKKLEHPQPSVAAASTKCSAISELLTTEIFPGEMPSATSPPSLLLPTVNEVNVVTGARTQVKLHTIGTRQPSDSAPTIRRSANHLRSANHQAVRHPSGGAPPIRQSANYQAEWGRWIDACSCIGANPWLAHCSVVHRPDNHRDRFNRV